MKADELLFFPIVSIDPKDAGRVIGPDDEIELRRDRWGGWKMKVIRKSRSRRGGKKAIERMRSRRPERPD